MAKTKATSSDPIALPEDSVVSPAATPVRTPRERIDVVLRLCQEDDPFVVDWAPPQA